MCIKLVSCLRQARSVAQNLSRVLLLFVIVLGSVKAFAAKIDIPQEFLSFNGEKSLVLVDPNGNTVIDVNGHVPRTLASVTKLYTAISALEYWGRDYHFKTRVYLAGNDIVIQGFGDPFFDIFEMQALAGQIQKVVTSVDNIVIDETAFGGIYRVDGQTDTRNPYDAPLGALALNFNTIALAKDKSGVVTSREDQVPLTPLAIELGSKYLAKGRKDRLALEQQQTSSATYYSEILRNVLIENGLTVKGDIKFEAMPKNARLIVEYKNSRTVRELLKPMLRYSTNFIANQLYIAMAADDQAPATLKGASEINAQMLGNAQVNPVIRFAEGAGLSESNRASGFNVLSMLDYWESHMDYMPQYKEQIFAKTGTLTGTSTLAGFIDAPDGLWRFCILLQRPGSKIKGTVRRDIAARMRDQILGVSQVGAVAE